MIQDINTELNNIVKSISGFNLNDIDQLEKDNQTKDRIIQKQQAEFSQYKKNREAEFSQYKKTREEEINQYKKTREEEINKYKNLLKNLKNGSIDISEINLDSI